MERKPVGEDSTGTIRVAIVDDEPIARSRLRRLLEEFGRDGVSVVLECSNAVELLTQGPAAALDVVFVDIEMPGEDGLSAVTRWPGQAPEIIVVSAHAQHALRAFDARVLDYLTKPVLVDRLRQALERAITHLGRRRVSVPDGAPSPSREDLTGRQLDILRLAARHRSNKEIARAMSLSHFTVRNHMSVLFRRFGVDSRRDLLARAGRAGLTDEDAGAHAQAGEGWPNSRVAP